MTLIKRRQLRKLVKHKCQQIIQQLNQVESTPGYYKIIYEPHVIDLQLDQTHPALYIEFLDDDGSSELFVYALQLTNEAFYFDECSFGHVTTLQFNIIESFDDFFANRSWQIGKALIVNTPVKYRQTS